MSQPSVTGYKSANQKIGIHSEYESCREGLEGFYFKCEIPSEQRSRKSYLIPQHEHIFRSNLARSSYLCQSAILYLGNEQG